MNGKYFMKKLRLLILLFVAGCATNGYVWDVRQWWMNMENSYVINFYDNEDKISREEYVSEKSVKSGEILTAYVGHSVVSDKIYRVTTYESNLVKANVTGYMNSASVPGIIPADKQMKVIGTIEIDGTELRIIPSQLENFVFLIYPDGSFYDEMGRIRGDRLFILDAEFVPSPDNLRMEPVKVTRSEQTKPVKGYDIKYQGVNLERMMFTYFDYSKYQNVDAGEFEDISFPLKRGPIDINGVKIRILNADRHKLEYILLDD